MGQYTVPQNVEAEDHILGPLTFRQFIYMMIGLGWIIITFAIFRQLIAGFIVIGVPPAILFLLLAFFRRDGQDFEHLLVAVVGFFAAPRKRLWIKEENLETFHITPTALKAEITQRNPQLVISELEKLATLIDSRGWNIPQSSDTNTHLIMPSTPSSARIVQPDATPSNITAPHTDMLDLKNSPLAQNLSVLLQQSASQVRQSAVANMVPGTDLPKPSHFETPAKSISGVTALGQDDILRLATQSEGMSIASVAAQATRLSPTAGATVETATSAS
ncbi:PrgI family protein [bacterium]|nr:MAG: PrgI family protein [bacterium]